MIAAPEPLGMTGRIPTRGTPGTTFLFVELQPAAKP